MEKRLWNMRETKPEELGFTIKKTNKTKQNKQTNKQKKKQEKIRR